MGLTMPGSLAYCGREMALASHRPETETEAAQLDDEGQRP